MKLRVVEVVNRETKEEPADTFTVYYEPVDVCGFTVVSIRYTRGNFPRIGDIVDTDDLFKKG